jgi:hypothetical protein
MIQALLSNYNEWRMIRLQLSLLPAINFNVIHVNSGLDIKDVYKIKFITKVNKWFANGR